MRIKLTETQIRTIKLITEGEEVVHTFLRKADDIKEIVNRMYSKLTFSTLAEIIEGETDLKVMLEKLEQLRTVMNTYNKKAEMFFNNMPEDLFYEKYEALQAEYEDKYQEVLYHKIDALDEMIEELRGLAEADIEEKFKDIKKMDM